MTSNGRSHAVLEFLCSPLLTGDVSPEHRAYLLEAGIDDATSRACRIRSVPISFWGPLLGFSVAHSRKVTSVLLFPERDHIASPRWPAAPVARLFPPAVRTRQDAVEWVPIVAADAAHPWLRSWQPLPTKVRASRVSTPADGPRAGGFVLNDLTLDGRVTGARRKRECGACGGATRECVARTTSERVWTGVTQIPPRRLTRARVRITEEVWACHYCPTRFGKPGDPHTTGVVADIEHVGQPEEIVPLDLPPASPGRQRGVASRPDAAPEAAA